MTHPRGARVLEAYRRSEDGRMVPPTICGLLVVGKPALVCVCQGLIAWPDWPVSKSVARRLDPRLTGFRIPRETAGSVPAAFRRAGRFREGFAECSRSESPRLTACVRVAAVRRDLTTRLPLGPPGTSAKCQWTQQEIEIPRDVADQIIALAELMRREHRRRRTSPHHCARRWALLVLGLGQRPEMRSG